MYFVEYGKGRANKLDTRVQIVEDVALTLLVPLHVLPMDASGRTCGWEEAYTARLLFKSRCVRYHLNVTGHKGAAQRGALTRLQQAMALDPVCLLVQIVSQQPAACAWMRLVVAFLLPVGIA